MTAEEFKAEVIRVRPTLERTALKYLGSKDDAEDMVQDAMLKLWTMCAELHSPIAPLAHILVRNLCIDKIRRHCPTTDITATDMADTDLAADEHEQIERIMGIIGTLPSAQQIMLRLRHINGMSFADIAELTGGSENAVRKAVSRARIAVRNIYMNMERGKRTR